MALRIKTKWHRSRRSRRNIEGSERPKRLEDLSSVVAFNIWKVAQETYRHMQKEDFKFSQDSQVAGVITEMIAFLVQIVDRIIYNRIEEDKRGPFVNLVANQLAETMTVNQEDASGPGDYRTPFIETLNSRFAEYAECPYSDTEGPGYAFKRVLGEKISDVMAASDNRWVIEHVMEIEAPVAAKTIRRLVTDVLGLRSRKQAD